MTDEVPKRRGRPPRIVSTVPENAPVPLDEPAASFGDPETAAFAAAKHAFAKASITITDLPAGHPKLATRGWDAQIMIRAAWPRFAVVGMMPRWGTQADLNDTIARMREDYTAFDRAASKDYASSHG